MVRLTRETLKIEIFVIDDDKDITDAIEVIFKMNGVENYRLFNDPNELLANLNDDVHICIVDYILKNDMNGLDLIKKIVKRNKHCWFIMLSGQGNNAVIIDYMNSVFGSRYIEKGSSTPLNVSLIENIREITEHINFIDDFYHTADRIKQGFKDMKNILIK